MILKPIIISLLLALYGCNAQSNSDDDGGSEDDRADQGQATATCVLGCVDQFQRGGVQEGPEQATTTAPPSPDETCDGLNIESIVHMCNAYLKADTCLQKCAKSITKETLINGFDTICVKRIEDFKKHLPCYHKQCPTINKECGEQRCGSSYSDASDQWLSFMRIKAGGESDLAQQNTTSRRRRKRGDENGVAGDASNARVVQVRNPNSAGETDEESSVSIPNDTCKFVSCKVNCSRPTIEKECGTDAYELLKQTSNILLAFLVVPFEQDWMSTFNVTNPPEGVQLCGPYAQLAALTTASTAASHTGYFWLPLLLLVPFASILVRRVQ